MTLLTQALEALENSVPREPQHHEVGYAYHKAAITALRAAIDAGAVVQKTALRAQPDHSELVNRLRDVAVRYPEDGYVGYVCMQAVNALDGL